MITLKPGDLVCAHRSSILGSLISDVEERCPCSLPYYGHAFIVTGSDGAIINTLEKVVVGNLFRDYSGIDVLIGRFTQSSPVRVQGAIVEISKDLGDGYPAWRLVADEFGVGREIHTDSKVCSERAAWFGWLAFGFKPFKAWAGWTPGNLAFALKYCNGFEVVLEGKI